MHTKRVLDELHVVQGHNFTPCNQLLAVHLVRRAVEGQLWPEQELDLEDEHEHQMVQKPHNVHWDHGNLGADLLDLLGHSLREGLAADLLACTGERDRIRRRQ